MLPCKVDILLIRFKLFALEGVILRGDQQLGLRETVVPAGHILLVRLPFPNFPRVHSPKFLEVFAIRLFWLLGLRGIATGRRNTIGFGRLTVIRVVFFRSRGGRPLAHPFPVLALSSSFVFPFFAGFVPLLLPYVPIVDENATVGDTVFTAETSPVIPLSVMCVCLYLEGAEGGDWEPLQNFGETVFLTREEAEAALKDREVIS